MHLCGICISAMQRFSFTPFKNLLVHYSSLHTLSLVNFSQNMGLRCIVSAMEGVFFVVVVVFSRTLIKFLGSLGCSSINM